ncbi:flagellar hook-associated protein FlgK [Ruminiclostridium papyrosolvens]|uniref:Flagellar hook-associated protein 1 n=1 Tax=Ruminiclostridium papyrosolvens C7 TaxID=1330534 RepID=U4R7A3_9FIRM|nr:flagellar hook-associated protein FlgK [Ruminiclostridium papyrosolvens]EPR14363.1 flagellar hook-associated protein FlgK [Ruminiclostridium papyrosolvens C7]
MQQSFFGLNIALSGLYTAQRNLDVVGHNLSNATTPGYSRQQSIQSASNPLAVMDGTGMVGTGSQVTGVQRIRDTYLDFKYWSENVANGEWSKKAELMGEIQVTFNEPSNSGFVKIMDGFFDSLQELSKDPSSGAARSLVVQKATTLTKYFNNTATHFEQFQNDINDQVKTDVDQINIIASQIQLLNKQIYNYELTGGTANDLRDSRTLLVDQLSKFANIQAKEISYGKLPNGDDDIHFQITLGGKTLVDHFSATKLTVIQRTTKLNEEDIGNLYDIKWEDGNSVNVSGGELRGLLDVRDGKDGIDGTPIYKGVPYYQKKLNEFVQTFAIAFNEGYTKIDSGYAHTGVGHIDGYGYDSNLTDTNPAPTDIRFFSMLGVGDTPISSADLIAGVTVGETDPDYINQVVAQYNKLTAKNFSVSSDIIDNANNIATSDADGQNGNTNILKKLMGIRSNQSLYKEGAPEDFMKSLVAGMGIDAQQAETFAKTQETLVKQVDNRRMSVSGVNLNEEMTNMVKFQQSYNAAARMIVTMGEIYDTLINKLGVG